MLKRWWRIFTDCIYDFLSLSDKLESESKAGNKNKKDESLQIRGVKGEKKFLQFNKLKLNVSARLDITTGKSFVFVFVI